MGGHVLGGRATFWHAATCVTPSQSFPAPRPNLPTPHEEEYSGGARVRKQSFFPPSSSTPPSSFQYLSSSSARVRVASFQRTVIPCESRWTSLCGFERRIQSNLARHLSGCPERRFEFDCWTEQQREKQSELSVSHHPPFPANTSGAAVGGIEEETRVTVRRLQATRRYCVFPSTALPHSPLPGGFTWRSAKPRPDPAEAGASRCFSPLTSRKTSSSLPINHTFPSQPASRPRLRTPEVDNCRLHCL